MRLIRFALSVPAQKQMNTQGGGQENLFAALYIQMKKP